MKTKYLMYFALCATLTACSDSDDPVANPAPNDPPPLAGGTPTGPDAPPVGPGTGPGTNPPVGPGIGPGTNPPVGPGTGPGTNPPVGPGTGPGTNPPVGNQGAEDQLLNQGTAQAPETAWSCPSADLSLVFGFFGQGNGYFGVADEATQEVGGGEAPYTFDASGNAQFTLTLDDGPLLIGLAAPNFIDGSSFSSSITLGNDSPYEVNCTLVSLSAVAPVGGGSGGTTDPTGLEAQLLNGGTISNPTDGWDCEGTLFGFYGAGQGRIGQSSTGSFNEMQYTIDASGTVTLSANGATGTLKSIQFAGPDNFETAFLLDGTTLVIECTRFSLSLAQSKASVEGQEGMSEVKAMTFDQQLALDASTAR